MRNLHPQTEIIDVLRSDSPEFRDFYLHNQALIKDLRIHWFENASLINGQCTTLRERAYEIELKEIPPRSETAFIVAHELYHCILWHSGYPILIPRLGTKDRRCKGIMGALNSMVYDHHINLKVRAFFDDKGCQFIKLRSEQYFDQKLKECVDVESEIGAEFLYANFRLNFEILCNANDIRDSDFFNWFNLNRPDIVTKSSDLISLIKSTNMDETEKVRQLFKEIMRRYPSLEPILVV